jgi:hypothetical protein
MKLIGNDVPWKDEPWVLISNPTPDTYKERFVAEFFSDTYSSLHPPTTGLPP